MSIARVRIHSAEGFNGQPADVIGLSSGASVNEESWNAYFEKQGQTVSKLPDGLAPRGGISEEYYVVQPPAASYEQLLAFGRACVGFSEGRASQVPIVDYSSDIVVIDNRQNDPSRYNPSDILASA